MVTETDFAWLAGFIDGDGAFSLRAYHLTGNRTRSWKRKTKPDIVQRKYKNVSRKMVQPVLQISQIDRRPIDHIITMTNQLGANPILNAEAQRPHIWHLQILGNKPLTRLIHGVLPYLVLKKAQAALIQQALQRQKDRPASGYTDEDWHWFFAIKAEIERLNQLS